MPAYEIHHCIYCERKDFANFEEVLEHVREEKSVKDYEEGKIWELMDDKTEKMRVAS